MSLAIEDSTPSFIFALCPECLRAKRAGLHAKMVTKFLIDSDLTAEQAKLMEASATEFVLRMLKMKMSQADLEKIGYLSARLLGEVAVSQERLVSFVNIRHDVCWLLDINTRSAPDGVEIDMAVCRAVDEAARH